MRPGVFGHGPGQLRDVEILAGDSCVPHDQPVYRIVAVRQPVARPIGFSKLDFGMRIAESGLIRRTLPMLRQSPRRISIRLAAVLRQPGTRPGHSARDAAMRSPQTTTSANNSSMRSPGLSIKADAIGSNPRLATASNSPAYGRRPSRPASSRAQARAGQDRSEVSIPCDRPECPGRCLRIFAARSRAEHPRIAHGYRAMISRTWSRCIASASTDAS